MIQTGEMLAQPISMVPRLDFHSPVKFKIIRFCYTPLGKKLSYEYGTLLTFLHDLLNNNLFAAQNLKNKNQEDEEDTFVETNISAAFPSISVHKINQPCLLKCQCVVNHTTKCDTHRQLQLQQYNYDLSS